MIKFPWFWQHLNTSYNPMMPRIVKQHPLESKEIKLVNVKENQPWILIWRTDAEAETPVFWSSDVNSWLTGKVPDAGKDWGQRKRGYQRMKFLDAITDAMDKNSGKLWEMVRDREAWHVTVHGVAKSWTQFFYMTNIFQSTDYSSFPFFLTLITK